MFEKLQERFENTDIPDEEVLDQLQDELDDLLEEHSRKEILEQVDELDEEFGDTVRQTLDNEIFEKYGDMIEEDRDFDEKFEETIESLRQDYSKQDIMSIAGQLSEEFEQKIRDNLE